MEHKNAATIFILNKKIRNTAFCIIKYVLKISCKWKNEINNIYFIFSQCIIKTIQFHITKFQN